MANKTRKSSYQANNSFRDLADLVSPFDFDDGCEDPFGEGFAVGVVVVGEDLSIKNEM